MCNQPLLDIKAADAAPERELRTHRLAPAWDYPEPKVFFSSLSHRLYKDYSLRPEYVQRRTLDLRTRSQHRT